MLCLNNIKFTFHFYQYKLCCSSLLNSFSCFDCNEVCTLVRPVRPLDTPSSRLIISSSTKAFLCWSWLLPSHQFAARHKRYATICFGRKLANSCRRSYCFLPLMTELRHYTKHQSLGDIFADLKPHELTDLPGWYASELTRWYAGELTGWHASEMAEWYAGELTGW